MANILIGIIGKDKDAGEVLLGGFKNFLPEVVVLLIKKGNEKNAQKIILKLEKLNLKIQTFEVSNFLKLEEVFIKIKEISKIYKSEQLVINVDCDYMSSCLALSSAFVNGIAAIGVLDDKIISYPIMKFSYYNAINEKKLEILKIIQKEGEVNSMEKLSKLTKLSLPLIAYHLRGNRDSKGLIALNLVETFKIAGIVKIKLTDLGNLIVSGNVDFNCNKKNCL